MKNSEEYKFDTDKTLFDGMDPIKLGQFPTSSEPGMSFPKVCGCELHHANRGTAIDDCV